MVYEWNKNLWQKSLIFILFFVKKKFSQNFCIFSLLEYNCIQSFYIKNMSMNKLTWKLAHKIKSFRRNRNSNLNIFVVCIAIVMIWRWVWDLLDMYVFPNHPLISNVICILFGIWVLLMDDGKLWELEEDPHRERYTKK